MIPSLNFAMGAAMAAVGVVAAALQAWLWTFPMAADPTGKDPNGKTTAPPFLRAVHRILGYFFAGLYAVLLSQMVPRLWLFEGQLWNVATTLHVACGVAILPLLVFKIAIVRRLRFLGKILPSLGAVLVLLTAIALSTTAPNYLRITSGEGRGPALLRERCFSCHGASRIAAESGDFEDWTKTLEDMKENAEVLNRPDPVRDDAAKLAEYLSAIRGERDDD